MYQVEQMTTGVTYTGLETVHGQSVMVKVVACGFVSRDSLLVVVPRVEQTRRNLQARPKLPVSRTQHGCLSAALTSVMV